MSKLTPEEEQQRQEEQKRIVTELHSMLKGRQFSTTRPSPLIGNTLVVSINSGTDPDHKKRVTLQVGHIDETRDSALFEGIEVVLVIPGKISRHQLDRDGSQVWLLTDTKITDFTLDAG